LRWVRLCVAGLTVTVPAFTPYVGAQEQARVDLPVAPSALVVPAARDLVTPAATANSEPLLKGRSVESETGVSGSQMTPVEDDPSQDQVTVKDQPRTIKQQQGRIFGVLPNFATVSGGTTPKPAGWKTDWGVANRQALDYSSFGYLFLSSGTAYAENSHPSLNTYHGGDAIFWAYLWRGFLDKTDGVYQGTFLFPALLREDTRFYASGEGPIWKRTLHAAGSIVIARSYSGRSIPNVAGIMGKVGTQAVSTVYYPPGSETFGVLAEKFTYACLRQAGINVFREFSPDLDDLVHHKRRKAQAAKVSSGANP
jgi:hypothetical protein